MSQTVREPGSRVSTSGVVLHKSRLIMVITTRKSPLTPTYVVVQAVHNVKPCIEVRKVRKSGRTILVPRVVPKSRQSVLAMRWLIESARQNQRKNKLNFSECLADELYYAFQKKGQARQKRDELHKIAQTNRAFLRFRW